MAAWRMLHIVRRERPALLMRYVRLEPPREAAIPPGYQIRSRQPGDDDRWVELLQACATFGDWDLDRLASEMRGLLRDVQFFAIHDGMLVASTGILERQLRGRPGLELAWVARHPEHRGNLLGLSVTVRALRAGLASSPGRPIHLHTDDHRLTAIGMYLDLGFAPDLTGHRSFPRRWEAVFRDLVRRRERSIGSGEATAGGGDDGPAPAPGQRTGQRNPPACGR